MTNYFRQLTLPMMLALLLMLLFSGLWYRYEATEQLKVQVQQLAAALQISLRPYLADSQSEQLQAYLTNVSYVSRLPLNALALYDHNGILLHATVVAAELPAFTPEINEGGFSLTTLLSGQLKAIQQIEPLPLDYSIREAGHAGRPYYLLLLAAPDVGYSSWLLPVLLIGLIGLLALAYCLALLQRSSQRLHIDISLISHKLQQLRQRQSNCLVNEQLVPELQPLKHSINQLAQQQLAEYAEMQQKLDECKQQHAGLTEQLQMRQQQLTGLNHHLQLALKQQHHLVNQALLLQEQQSADDGMLAMQQSLLRLLSLHSQVELSEMIATDLSDWLMQHSMQLEQCCADHCLNLDVIEAKDNVRYLVALPDYALADLTLALLQLIGRMPDTRSLTLRLLLEAETGHGARLRLAITSDGEGLTQRSRQLLQQGDLQTLQYHEADIGLISIWCQRLQAELNIQSLDGLGCAIQLDIPVTVSVNKAKQPLKQLLVFDVQDHRIAERKGGLQQLAMKVDYCTRLTQLEQKASMPYERVLVFLPAPSELSGWRSVLQQIAQHSQLLCYAQPAELAAWQQVIPQVESGLFCLQKLMVAQQPGVNAQLPNVLLVDDNATNLAFMQVLLQKYPLILTTAGTGLAALQLCQQQPFDLILLDIQLPDIGGIEVAEQLRRLPAYQTVPVLAFTAHALDDEVQRYRQAGMNDVVFKPMEPARLPDILKWLRMETA